ncbi:hypothetical protein CROQUDRAFT_723603 [Cronartium quercuum f. sp. fusiforme G11]|uniref:U6 snRNA phosphodiesterase 1 n=1 Tax=Cronartium quercuum f. sp. fusiforme G11 TaxID=708437 RepID=A0A9P6TAY1_9BASI|nr:hypothetical protein CROQUDRAFT_723603 [Cronartium quercuum f. sp. fusiforme G11]
MTPDTPRSFYRLLPEDKREPVMSTEGSTQDTKAELNNMSENSGTTTSTATEPTRRRRRVLPPPCFSSTTTSSKPRTARPCPIDDPTLHQGRKRSKPHVEGDWPTHIYLSLEIPDEVKKLIDKVVEQLPQDTRKWHSLMITQDNKLHLSLSRPLTLKAHQRQTFRSSLTHAISKAGHVKFHFARFCSLVNDDRSREFLALEVGSGHSTLKELIERINWVLSSFCLEEYYSKPIFHSSLCWRSMKDEVDEKLIIKESILQELNEIKDLDLLRSLEWVIEEVKLVIGKSVWSMELKNGLMK